MVGDGVNGARALKAAHVGVAMASGSAVTRDVADIVLTDDSLAALLPPSTKAGASSAVSPRPRRTSSPGSARAGH